MVRERLFIYILVYVFVCARANMLPWETPRPPRVRKEADGGGGGRVGCWIGGVAVARIHKRHKKKCFSLSVK